MRFVGEKNAEIFVQNEYTQCLLLYIVREKETEGESTIAGTFIYGKRNAAPWEGFGKQGPTQEDE